MSYTALNFIHRYLNVEELQKVSVLSLPVIEATIMDLSFQSSECASLKGNSDKFDN